MKKLLNLFLRRKTILCILILLIILLTSAPIKTLLKQAFEYNSDEGINLMKSLLFSKGFILYKDIWSDQPPLFTVILSFWLKLFGMTVDAGRMLVLFFSIILLFSFYQTVRITTGRLCAVIAVVFLILSSGYLTLSVSVMIGIPSLALAMLSVYFALFYIHKKEGLRFLILSGIFMALSLQIKLISAFLVPVILFEIIKNTPHLPRNAKSHARTSPFALLWLCSVITVWLCITIIFFDYNTHMFIQQLVYPHLQRYAFETTTFDFRLIADKLLFEDYDIFIIALLGIALSIRQKQQKTSLAFLWLISVFIILLSHKPVWLHHYLLISIPLCWIAALTFKGIFRRDNNGSLFSVKEWLRYLTAILLIIFILRLPIRFQRIRESINGAADKEGLQVINLLLKYKPSTRWILTDSPIYAFYGKLLVPPELAVISYKRITTGNLSPEYLLSKIKKYRPEQILLVRFYDYSPEIMSFIEENYILAYQIKSSVTQKKRLYIRKDIEKNLTITNAQSERL